MKTRGNPTRLIGESARPTGAAWPEAAKPPISSGWYYTATALLSPYGWASVPVSVACLTRFTYAPDVGSDFLCRPPLAPVLICLLSTYAYVEFRHWRSSSFCA